MQIQTALNQANRAYLDYQKTSVNTRKIILQVLANQIKSQPLKFATLISIQSSKLLADSLKEIQYCVDLLHYELQGKSNVDLQGDSQKNFYQLQKKYTPGIQVVVASQNYPFVQIISHCVGAFLNGDAIIFMGCSKTLLCLTRLGDLFYKCGLPVDLFLVVNQELKNIIAYLGDTRIREIHYQGTASKAFFLEALAKFYGKKSYIEKFLGEFAVILNDADLSVAINTILDYRLKSGAELTLQAQLIYVDAALLGLAKQYINKVLDTVKLGSALKFTTNAISTNIKSEIDTISNLIEMAILQGAQLEYGFNANKLDSLGYLRPVVLSRVTPEMDIFHSKIKAPVVLLSSFDSLEQVFQNYSTKSVGSHISFFTGIQHKVLYQLLKPLGFEKVDVNQLSNYPYRQINKDYVLHDYTSGKAVGSLLIKL